MVMTRDTRYGERESDGREEKNQAMPRVAKETRPMNQDYLHDIEAVGARTCLTFRLRVSCLFVDTNLERAIEGHQTTCRGDMPGGRR